jgi:transposase
MARKNYSDEFRRQAVELYESTPGATVRGIAEDLGIERGTLRVWLERLGTGRKTAADGTAARSPLTPRSSRRPCAGGAGSDTGEPETAEQRLARLEAENAALRAEKSKLVTEREILRAAAKYFAGETNW